MSDELRIAIALDSPVPVYRQLVDQMRALCVEGSLAPDRKLPSVREIAADLGIHHNTVAEAYRTLAEEGWIAIEHGRGARVIDRHTPRTPTGQTRAAYSARVRQFVAELRAHGLQPEWIRTQINLALAGKGE